jgi:hypothetical protein
MSLLRRASWALPVLLAAGLTACAQPFPSRQVSPERAPSPSRFLASQGDPEARPVPPPAASAEVVPASSGKPQEQEPPPAPALRQDPPEPPRLRLDRDEGGFLDFEWLEVQPRVGIATFSEDFEIDPSPFVSLLFHAPMPWLSPASDPGGEYFGVFLEFAAVPGVDRNLDPEPSDPSGSIVMVNVGADFTLLRNQSLYLVLQGGGQYTSYGGISDLDDGWASLAGLSAGVYLGGGLTLSLGQEAVFAHAGDHILLTSLGLLIEF